MGPRAPCSHLIPSESQKEAANLKCSLEERRLHTPQEHAAHTEENGGGGDDGWGGEVGGEAGNVELC